MLLFIPLDFNILLPVSGLVDRLLLDFDVVDVMVWFPRLTWGEFGRAMGAVLVCKCISDQLSRWAFAPLKSRIKRRLVLAVVSRWPQAARRLRIAADA